MKKFVAIMLLFPVVSGCALMRSTSRDDRQRLSLEMLNVMSTATCMFVKDKYPEQTVAVLHLIEFGFKPLVVVGNPDDPKVQKTKSLLFDEDFDLNSVQQVTNSLVALSGNEFDPDVVAQVMKLLRLVSAFIQQESGIFVDEDELWLAAIDSITSGCEDALKTKAMMVESNFNEDDMDGVHDGLAPF